MIRSFYATAIFLTGLYLLITLFRNIMAFQLGARMGELSSLAGWVILEFLVSLIWSLVLLKYFHYKQYKFACWAMIVSIAASLYHFILLNTLLKTSEFTNDYIVATLILLGTGILYAVSLIFSGAGKRPWLKAAGIISCCLGLIMFSSVIWAFNSLTVLHNGTITKIQQWVELIGFLVPVLFIMNFRNERATAEKAYTPRPPSLQGFVDFAAFVALLATLVFGFKLTSESIWLANHPDQVGEYLKKLAQPYEARTYVNSQGETLSYRLMIPLDYDATQQYPLVVCLHGSSGRGTDNVKQVVASLPARLLSDQENRTKYPAFLFVPQCPPETDWGGITHIPAVDSLVFESILSLEKEFEIDVDRRYVAGNSMGGYGTWHLICTRPEMFAAAIPISGAGNPALAQKIVDMPVWAFHGAKDKNVLVKGSRDMIEAIRKEGGNPRYTEFPDKAHHISEDVKNTPGLLDWLFAQERDELK